MEEYPDFIEFSVYNTKEGKSVQKAILRLNEIDLNREISPTNDSYFLHFDRVDESKKCTISMWNSTNLLSTYEEMNVMDIGKRLTSKRGNTSIVLTICDIFGEEKIPDFIRKRISEGCTLIHTEWIKVRKEEEEEEPEPEVEINEILYERYREEILEEVKKIMASENPMDSVLKHLDNIIAGETENKGLLFVLALSGKSKNKKKKIIVCALHEAGAGKTWLLKNIAALYKSHTVSHLTKKALNYIGEDIKDKEILFIKELGNLDTENDDSNASIKMLSVDDGGLSTTYTYRDPDSGLFETRTIKTDPISIFTSSTRQNLDPQFQRRNWVISPDASYEQTARIERFKVKNRRQEDQVLLGLREYTDMDWALFVLKALVETIEEKRIIVPYHSALYDILDKRKTRIRGDMDKLDLLIEFFGYLNYGTLPKIEKDGNIIYVMTPEKVLEILRVARMSLVYMARDTEARVYDLLQMLKTVKWTDNAENSRIGISASTADKSADIIDLRLQRIIANQMGKDRKTVLGGLNTLVSAGYARTLEGAKGRGNTSIYVLENDPEYIEHELSGYQSLITPSELEKIYLGMISEGNEELAKYKIDIKFEPKPDYIKKLYEDFKISVPVIQPKSKNTLDGFN